MNPIQIPMMELKPALAGLGKVITNRATLPILGGVRIDRHSDGLVELTGTDLDHFATVRLNTRSDGDAISLVIPYEDLIRTARSCLRTDTLDIESLSESAVTLRISTGSQIIENRAASLAVEEFPEVPNVTGRPVPLPLSVCDSLQEAFQCASVDETRYVLQSACIDVSDRKCHHVVATDGRHLYTSNSFTLPLLNESLIIPTHKFLAWRDFASEDGIWNLRVKPAVMKEKEVVQYGWMQLTGDRWRYISKTIDGTFPNYRQVVPDPTSYKTTVLLEPTALDEIIRTIQRMPDHDATNHRIGLVVKHGLQFVAAVPDGQPARVEIKTDRIIGRPVTIFVNREFMIKALKFGLNKLEIIDGMSPMKFSHGGRQMIVMPVRPDADEETAASSTPPPEPPTEQSAADAPAPPEVQPQPAPPSVEPTERNTMPEDNQAPEPEPSALDAALAQLEIVRNDLRSGIIGINKLHDLLKRAGREQKASEKEVQSVRQTIKSLQGVRI